MALGGLAVAACVAAFGGLDIMFNNAGVPGSIRAIEDIDVEAWDRTVSVHLRRARRKLIAQLGPDYPFGSDNREGAS